MDGNLPCKREREEPTSRPKRARVPVLNRTHSVHDLVPLIAASDSMSRVFVSSDAMFTMSLHSHLCSDEVIGWMAGSISDDLIEIKQSFPVRAIQHENGRINVEMDVEDAVQVRSIIEEKGLSIIGWYHSHPTFDVLPSLVDIDNQLNYQSISEKQFIGGIVSPYYSQNKVEGIFNLFNVKKNNEESKRNGYHPAYSVRYCIGNEEISKDCISAFENLIGVYKSHKKFIQVNKRWKKGLTIIDKIQKALEYYNLPSSDIQNLIKLLK